MRGLLLDVVGTAAQELRGGPWEAGTKPNGPTERLIAAGRLELDIGRGRERIRRLLASLVMGYHAPDARPLRW